VRTGEPIWQRLADNPKLTAEPLPGVPIVELAGDRRVLIENHQGVRGYSSSCILVKVPFGCIQICGSCLELAKMTREQLVIQGKIDSICLQRR